MRPRFNNTKATAIELNANSVLTVTGGRALSSINFDEEINGAGPDEGTLIFTGGDSTISGLLIGETNKIHELRIASAHNLTTDSSINATEINFTADGSITTHESITGDIDNTTGGNGVGTLNLIDSNGNIVDGEIGNTKSLTAIDVGMLANNDADVVATLKGSVINADTITISSNSTNAGGGNKTSTLVLDSTIGAQVVTGAVDSTAVANGGTSTLNFIGGNGTTVTDKIGNANALTAINVKSGATAILSNAVVKAGMINIGEAGGAGKLVRGGAVDFTINNGVDTNVAFDHANSLLEFRNTDGGADHTVTLHNNLAGAGDNEARIRLNSTGAGHQLVINRNAAETIGVSAVNRVKELIADGTATTTINPQTFAKVLSLGGNTGVVNFVNGLDMGSGSTVNVNQNATLQGDRTNTGGGITINLGQNTLTYNQGTAAFIGAVVINTNCNN